MKLRIKEKAEMNRIQNARFVFTKKSVTDVPDDFVYDKEVLEEVTKVEEAKMAADKKKEAEDKKKKK